MIKDTQTKIEAFLKKNHLTPRFPYSPGKTLLKKDFAISWTHNYTTIATREGKEYFLKIAIDPEKYEDLRSQVHFMQYLHKHKLTFKIPKIYEWNTSGNFYFYLREHIKGELLGNYVRNKIKFAKETIFSKLEKGIEEINDLAPDLNYSWKKGKDTKWLRDKVSQLVHDKQIVSSLPHATLNIIDLLITNVTADEKEDYVPIWGDPGANNFIVAGETLAFIDYAPFSLGYRACDIAEFSSFCVFSKEWETFIDRLDLQNKPLFREFFIIFLLDRIRSIFWLEGRGQLHKQLTKPREYYLEAIKKYIARLV